ncbi:MAG: hypothetical protein IPM76_24345 [Chloroflexi bacterium]|nr:hypothetical protein [Chloroflexota bacterium]
MPFCHRTQPSPESSRARHACQLISSGVMGNLQTNSLQQSGAPLTERILYGLIGPLIGQDIRMGVLPQLYASTAPEAKGGVFYGPKTFRVRGYPVEQPVTTPSRMPRCASASGTF